VPWLSQAKSLRNKPYPCHFRGRLVTVVTGSGLLVPRPVATLGTAGRNRHRRNKGVSSSVATLGTAGWNRHRCNKGVSSSVATLGATGWNRHRCNKTASVPIATLGAAGRNRHRCNKTASVSIATLGATGRNRHRCNKTASVPIATLGATGRNRHRRNHRLLALQRRMGSGKSSRGAHGTDSENERSNGKFHDCCTPQPKLYCTWFCSCRDSWLQ
jgi:hypothetical protein